ncbi:MAG: hypothetical protein ACE5KV_08005, partial [Thermoplasmata archaeon]
MPTSINSKTHFCLLLSVSIGVTILLFVPNAELVLNSAMGPINEIEGRTWKIYIVDKGWRSSLDVDSSCTPHISYHTVSDRVLMYATRRGGKWSLQTVDNRSGSGHTTSLVLDSNDRPIMARLDVAPHPDQGALKLTHLNESGWVSAVVVNRSSTDFSLALNSRELPAITYFKTYVPEKGWRALWIATLSPDGTWDHELVDSLGNLRYSSLYIDSKDHYHISYEELGSELRYAYWNGSNWGVEKVDTEGVIGAWSSIGVDNNGKPHVAYYDGTHRKVKYATVVDDTWKSLSVDDMIGPGLSLDLDSLGRPHISYQGLDHHLRHAWWDNSSWRTEIVDNNPYVGIFSTMRIDQCDDIHISYMDEKNLLTKYATTRDFPIGGIKTTIDINPDTLNL